MVILPVDRSGFGEKCGLKMEENQVTSGGVCGKIKIKTGKEVVWMGVWNHDLMEDILALLDYLEKKGVPVDRSTDPEIRGMLPAEGAMQTAYDMMRLMDKIPGGFMIYRADGDERIVYVNRGLLRIFRCETWAQFRETTCGSFRGLVHPEDLNEVEESVKRQIAESQYDLDYVEYRIIRRDRTTAWIEDYGHFVHSEQVGDFFYVFLADVTEKVNEAIRQEMQKKKILAEALENAELAIEAKDRFLSNMSHNMRTPMNTILGLMALAKLRTEDPGLLDCLRQAELSGLQLLDMIEKVLEVSSTGSRRQEAEEECDLCQVMEEVSRRFRGQALDKGLALELDCSQAEHTRVWAGRDKLDQLLSELLRNAVTYTGPGGRILIRLKEEELGLDGRRTYRLSVEDTGVGMSREFLKHLFEPFAREQDTTHSGVNGMGLGLTIAKYTVDRMGGTIRADSSPGRGSVFTVTLRLREAAGAPAEGPEEKTAPGQILGQRILLVEDNEINREIETEILQENGFLVDTAEDGDVAVEMVKRSAPRGYDLVLMDLQMPVMDGWTAARLIRELDDPVLARTPIVALSANSQEQDIRRSMDCGMDGHLPKPISIPQLLEKIRQTAGRCEPDKNS